MILLNTGFKKIPWQEVEAGKLENEEKKLPKHTGAFCFSCGSETNVCIEGPRYKCVNCPNLDACSKCEFKHL